ncbi:hypothetical protein TNCV_3311611 [Trichonephila clavipes]|nr:hypothetical protein TNCV_3311611 [Trichonephila clavipes]
MVQSSDAFAARVQEMPFVFVRPESASKRLLWGNKRKTSTRFSIYNTSANLHFQLRCSVSNMVQILAAEYNGPFEMVIHKSVDATNLVEKYLGEIKVKETNVGIFYFSHV